MDGVAACEVFICGLLGPAGAHNRTVRRAAGPLTVVHFDYERHGEQRVADEFIVLGQVPASVLTLIATYGPAPDHTITLIARPQTEQKSYEQVGYHLIATEYLMVRALVDLPPSIGRYTIQVARTADEARWLNAHDPADDGWISLPELHEPRLQHYFIALDHKPVARARALDCDATDVYVSHVYTAASHRRRGLARALMTHLLAEAATRGLSRSVLFASEEGAPLYQALGYTTLGTVLVFKPQARQEQAE